jgi:hypothetical protein
MRKYRETFGMKQTSEAAFVFVRSFPYIRGVVSGGH